MVPASQCKRLYEFDKTLRFGVAWLPNRGRTVFIAKLMPRHEVGGDGMGERRLMYFMPHDSPGFDYIQDRKGNRSSSSDWGGMVPTIFGWPGQTLGNQACCNGDYVSMLIYHGKPKYVIEDEHREAVAASGREKDNLCKEHAREAVSYHKHLQKNHAESDPLVLKEDILKNLKSDKRNENFLKTLDNDKADSFEAESLRDAGFL